ncbi:MAG: nuclear transport factor 2 family protein [Acidobacteria bacterium]|nr:nuclear transport factor 2 family protein [Acidobacteriota bacterium]
MKKSLALAALLVAASACTTTTNTNTGAGNANANANANTTAAATPTPAAGLTQADLEAKERQVYDAIKAKNWDAFGGMLADDFSLVVSDGVHNKAQTLESIKQYNLVEYTISDVRLVKVDADLAVLTYTMNEKTGEAGKETQAKPYRASSAWVNRGGKWLNAYHQESEVAEMPAATPTPAASPAASPSASPAASPAATPAAPASATDAEKAVWEAIKAKNIDAFAGYILPEALEVEPEGVFDKATQVKMIAMFDGSKFTQSDFKETKFDADATLVTYTVKGPVAGKNVTEYHSTIWTNRGGQWRAAFHQGTRQQAPGK